MMAPLLDETHPFDNFVRVAGLSIVLQLLAYGLIYWLGKPPPVRIAGYLVLSFGTIFGFVSLLIVANQGPNVGGLAKTVPSWLSSVFGVYFFVIPLLILSQGILERFLQTEGNHGRCSKGRRRRGGA